MKLVNRVRIKIRIIDLLIFMLFFSVFKIEVLPDILRKGMKVGLVVLVFLYLVAHLDVRKLWNPALLLAASMVVSNIFGYIRAHIPLSSLLDGILYALCVYDLYLMVVYAHQKEQMQRMIRVLFYLSGFYCVGCLITMIIYGHSDSTSLIDSYFCGNKFFTSYMFMQFTALFWMTYQHKIYKKKYRLLYFLLCVMTFFVADWLYCSTAVVGSMVLLTAPFVPGKLKKLLRRPTIAVIVVIGSAAILSVIESILQIHIVKVLIQDVLGESLHLTGRTAIYTSLSNVITKSPLLGYGYSNTSIRQVVGYGNAQNGLLEIMVGQGVVGVVAFLILIWSCFKKGKVTHISWGIYAMLYALIVCAIVEVSYNYNFYLFLFLLTGLGQEKKGILCSYEKKTIIG